MSLLVAGECVDCGAEEGEVGGVRRSRMMWLQASLAGELPVPPFCQFGRVLGAGVFAGVDEDAVEPGFDCGARAEGAAVFDDAEPGVLDGFEREIAAAGEGAGEAEKLGLVARRDGRASRSPLRKRARRCSSVCGRRDSRGGIGLESQRRVPAPTPCAPRSSAAGGRVIGD